MLPIRSVEGVDADEQGAKELAMGRLRDISRCRCHSHRMKVQWGRKLVLLLVVIGIPLCSTAATHLAQVGTPPLAQVSDEAAAVMARQRERERETGG